MTEIRLMTWNMYGTVPRQDLSQIFDKDYQIYVIAAEECENSILRSFCCNKKLQWRKTIENELRKCGKYILIGECEMNAMLLEVYVSSNIIESVSCVEMFKTKVGKMGLSNKGCLNISFCYNGTPLLFTNVHFSPHVENINKRIEEYNKNLKQIEKQEMCYHQSIYHSHEPNIKFGMYEFVFLLGDFNMGSTTDFKTYEKLQLEERLKYDEMQIFSELFNIDDISEINFSPSYKLNPSGGYNSKKTPAYTDRIMEFTNKDYEEKQEIFSNNIISDIQTRFMCPICETVHEEMFCNTGLMQLNSKEMQLFDEETDFLDYTDELMRHQEDENNGIYNIETKCYESLEIRGSDHLPVVGTVLLEGIQASDEKIYCFK